MAIKIRQLKQSGIVFYPQTVDKAIYVESKKKTLDAVLADLAAADVTVDIALNTASLNPVANKAVVVGLAAKMDIATFNAKVGAANGIVPLSKNKKIDSVYLPGYVDDVIDINRFILDKDKGMLAWQAEMEGIQIKAEYYYITDTKKLIGHDASTRVISEISPEGGKLYINKVDNKTYRWSGTTLVVISETIALGETSSTAYPGSKGKSNADAIVALKASVNGITDRQDLHADDINNLENEVINAKTHVESNSKSITLLNASLTSEKSKISSLQTDMTSAKSNITNLNASVQTLNGSVGTANTSIDAVKARVSTIEGAYISCQDTGGEVAFAIPAGIYQ